MKHGLIILILLLAAAVRASEQKADDLPKGVEVKDYTGWKESLYLKAADCPVRAVIVPIVGGRVLNFSLDGENILFENAAANGRDAGDKKGRLWVGGYQCDIGPETVLRRYRDYLFVGPTLWRSDEDYTVVVHSPDQSWLRLQVEKEFVMAPDTGNLGVMQRLRNISDKPVECSVWDRTLCKGGGFALIPLNKNSRHKAGWAVQRKDDDNRVYYEGENPLCLQARAMDGVLVVEAVGEAAKIGADSDGGWIAYIHGRLLFVKYFPYFPGAKYGDGGNSVALYFDQRVAELEPLGPLITLEPGNNYSFPEQWTLQRLDAPVTTYDQARAIVRKIPPSPFKKKNAPDDK